MMMGIGGDKHPLLNRVRRGEKRITQISRIIIYIQQFFTPMYYNI